MPTADSGSSRPAAGALLVGCLLLSGCSGQGLPAFDEDVTTVRGVIVRAAADTTAYLGGALAGLLAQTGYFFSDLFGDPATQRGAYEALARVEGCEHAVEIIEQAAAATRVSANYLLALARQESGCRADARAASSTAYGMFQFIESTWLVAIHRHGATYGERRLAEAVAIDLAGRPVLRQPALRQEILAKRSDAQLAAYLAAELALENARHLQQHRRQPLTATDLYMAHFLGAQGATAFLQELDRQPRRPAHDLLPRAASANPHVFYERGNRSRPRTVAAVYNFFQQRIEVA